MTSINQRVLQQPTTQLTGSAKPMTTEQAPAPNGGNNGVKPSGKQTWRTTNQAGYDDIKKNGLGPNAHYGDHVITGFILDSCSYTFILDNGDRVTFQVNPFK